MICDLHIELLKKPNLTKKMSKKLIFILINLPVVTLNRKINQKLILKSINLSQPLRYQF